jgi:hypothetical protein
LRRSACRTCAKCYCNAQLEARCRTSAAPLPARGCTRCSSAAAPLQRSARAQRPRTAPSGPASNASVAISQTVTCCWRATLIHFAQAQVVEAARHERFVQCLCQRSLEVCSSIAWRNQMNQQNKQSPTQPSVSQHLDCLSHSTQAPGGRTDCRPSTWRCRWQR